MPLPSAHDGVAVVTGAASGIGRALVTQLADRGFDVLAVDKDADGLAALPASVGTRVCDLTDRAQRAELTADLAAQPVAVLCNNAGAGTFGAFAETDSDALRRQVELDVVATHELVLAVLPGMVEAGTGAILMTGSVAGNHPVPWSAGYAACKAFVNSLAESLHEELRGTGVSCTLVAPGAVRTGFGDRAGVGDTAAKIPGLLYADAEQVARAGLAALGRGRLRTTPTLPGKLLAVAGRLAPHHLLLPVARRLIERGVGPAPAKTARSAAATAPPEPA